MRRLLRAILQAHFHHEVSEPHAVPTPHPRAGAAAIPPHGEVRSRDGGPVMGDERLLDVYEAAFLAGGRARVVDTALVGLVETGGVRVQRAGQLSVVDDRPRHPIEDAVLAAIGPHGYRQFELVRWMAGKDERVTALTERLGRDGPGSRVRLPWSGRGGVRTAAGRRPLRRWRADPAVTGVAAGTSAASVALHGTRQMHDQEQRDAVFPPPGPHRQWRRRRG